MLLSWSYTIDVSYLSVKKSITTPQIGLFVVTGGNAGCSYSYIVVCGSQDFVVISGRMTALVNVSCHLCIISGYAGMYYIVLV